MRSSEEGTAVTSWPPRTASGPSQAPLSAEPSSDELMHHFLATWVDLVGRRPAGVGIDATGSVTLNVLVLGAGARSFVASVMDEDPAPGPLHRELDLTAISPFPLRFLLSADEDPLERADGPRWFAYHLWQAAVVVLIEGERPLAARIIELLSEHLPAGVPLFAAGSATLLARLQRDRPDVVELPEVHPSVAFAGIAHDLLAMR